MRAKQVGCLGVSAIGLIAVMVAGCGGDGTSVEAETAADEIRQENGKRLLEVYDHSESSDGTFLNVQGRILVGDGGTTIALFNRSQSTGPGILAEIAGSGRAEINRFDADVAVNIDAGGLSAAPGDCISVANAGPGATLEKAKRVKELGAFAFARLDDDPRGRLREPRWAVHGPKVYPSVEACLADPIRALDPFAEALAEVSDTTPEGNWVRITGYIEQADGASTLLLRNVSQPEHNGPDDNLARVEIVHEYPFDQTSTEPFDERIQWTTPANGDCIAVVGEIFVEQELGAFRWCHATGGNTCPKGIQLFESSEACLSASE